MQSRIITGVLMFVAILIVFIINNYILNFILLGAVLYFAFNESIKLYEIDHIFYKSNVHRHPCCDDSGLYTRAHKK